MTIWMVEPIMTCLSPDLVMIPFSAVMVSMSYRETKVTTSLSVELATIICSARLATILFGEVMATTCSRVSPQAEIASSRSVQVRRTKIWSMVKVVMTRSMAVLATILWTGVVVTMFCSAARETISCLAARVRKNSRVMRVTTSFLVELVMITCLGRSVTIRFGEAMAMTI